MKDDPRFQWSPGAKWVKGKDWHGLTRLRAEEDGARGTFSERWASLAAPELAFSLLVCAPFLLGIPMLVFIGWRWQFHEAEVRLKQWAERLGYRVIDRRYRVFRLVAILHHETLAGYRFTIEDRQGGRRSGWICFGIGVWPFSSQRQDVVWDEERAG